MSENRLGNFHKPTFDNISEEKRRNILTVAVEEFSSQGYENANINIIAKKAGVSVGSLYKYFDTKTDLFLTTVTFGIGFLEDLLGEIVMSDEDILIKLEKILRSAIVFSRENSEMIKLYNEFTTESNAELGHELASRMESITADAYRHSIIQAQISGEIRMDIDPGMAAFIVDNILTMFQFSYACEYHKTRFKIYTTEDIFEKDEFVVQNVLRFVKAALQPPKWKKTGLPEI